MRRANMDAELFAIFFPRRLGLCCWLFLSRPPAEAAIWRFGIDGRAEC